MKRSDRCELLMPAGGSTQFIAAVENGADAVYVGGKSFNARMNAGNFSDEELARAVDYAHLRNVKTYVTMNTLLADEELAPALRQAQSYARMGVDALIIQDLGLGLVLRENLPDLPLHLSTQAGVYDAAGVQAAAELGYERVVLARELTLAEIEKAAATGIEIEVFVHGALCICYSGQCQLSRAIGGRSGNRGGCAQPCRLPYSGAKQKYPLSPKDLCLLPEIGALVRAGVASLKIEGRMKSAEYVAVVTAIYRKYLDRCFEQDDFAVEEEDISALRQIFNRDGFTKGYYYGDPGQKLMSGDIAKNTGLLAGRVLADSRGPLIKIQSLGGITLEKGDYAELRPDADRGADNASASAPDRAPASGLITYTKQLAPDRQEIGDFRSGARRGDLIYRLASGQLMEKARLTFARTEMTGGAGKRREPVALRAAVAAGKPLVLTATFATNDRGDVSVTRSGATVSVSRSGESCGESVRKQLAKTGDTPFSAGSIEVEEEGACFVPVSAVNALRREALAELAQKVTGLYKRGEAAPASSAAVAAAAAAAEKTDGPAGAAAEGTLLELIFYSAAELKKADLKRLPAAGVREIRLLVPLHHYEEARRSLPPEEAGQEPAGQPQITLSPYILSMNKGAGDEWIAANFDRLAALLKAEQCPLYAGSLRWLRAFSRAGVTVIAGSGLNATNRQSERALRLLGAAAVRPSLETEDGSSGAFPLMISEHRFDAENLTDRKGVRYHLHFDEFTHKTLLLRAGQSPDLARVRAKIAAGQPLVRLYMSAGGPENER